MKKLFITDRVDNVTKIPPEYLNVIVPPPKTVKIGLTNACNLACKFCANSQKERKVHHMPWELFKSITKEVKDAGVQEVGVFYLGESFLYEPGGEWKLHEAIAWLKGYLNIPRVFLTTNGVLATKTLVEAVMMAKLDSLKFSFNFANEEQAKEYCGRNVYRTIIKNIRDAKVARDEVFRVLGHWCGLYASSMKYNEEQVDNMREALREVEGCIDEHYWIPFCNQGGVKSGQTKIKGNIGRLGNVVEPLPCWSLFTSAHITDDGDVTVCCFDHNNNLVIGNLFEDKFMDIWNGEKIQELRRKHLNRDVSGTPCDNCVNG